MESKMNQQYRDRQKQQKPTGEVTIEKDTTGKPKHNMGLIRWRLC